MDPFTLTLEGDIIRMGRTHIVIRCDHTTTVTTATLLVMLNDRIGFEGEFQRTSFACSFRRFVRIEGFRGSRHLICHAQHSHHQIDRIEHVCSHRNNPHQPHGHTSSMPLTSGI